MLSARRNVSVTITHVPASNGSARDPSLRTKRAVSGTPRARRGEEGGGRGVLETEWLVMNALCGVLGGLVEFLEGMERGEWPAAQWGTLLLGG